MSILIAFNVADRHVSWYFLQRLRSTDLTTERIFAMTSNSKLMTTRPRRTLATMNSREFFLKRARNMLVKTKVEENERKSKKRS